MVDSAAIHRASAPLSRAQRSQASILEAAAAVLTANGADGLTIDAVMRQAGVAKTTIYRHWPTRQALLDAASAHLGVETRSLDSRERLLDATSALVTERGPGAFSIESLIQATGVARTTIYRYWPRRDDLLAAALERLGLEAVQVDSNRDLILRAAVDMMVNRWSTALTLDAVAEKAGVAKATLYRHWTSRRELMTAAIKYIGGETRIPDTGALRDDLLEYFLEGEQVRTARGERRGRIQSLPGVIDAAQGDSELQARTEEVRNVALKALSTMLERGKGRGEVRPDEDVAAITHILLGAMYLRARMGQALDPAFIRRIVDLIVDGVAP